ncbi:8712_t:CDS:10 [Diversispora eburnea]|uniref:8712_t:CDS:1 n=1 Tax=Diversispora eburnea TaxID=1213867 RepID=A0A9N9A2U0_9GLOM|nr:8712_t:CDS:10 [Diversispora eburnea]
MFLKKSKPFSFLITLSILVFFLVSSHAYFIRRDLATGTKIITTFNNLGGSLTFTKLDTGGTGVNGQFTKGITDSNPRNYVLKIGDGVEDTFLTFGIQITPPGTNSFTLGFPVLFDSFVGKSVLIEHNGQIIDQSTITVKDEARGIHPSKVDKTELQHIKKELKTFLSSSSNKRAVLEKLVQELEGSDNVGVVLGSILHGGNGGELISSKNNNNNKVGVGVTSSTPISSNSITLNSSATTAAAVTTTVTSNNNRNSKSPNNIHNVHNLHNRLNSPRSPSVHSNNNNRSVSPNVLKTKEKGSKKKGSPMNDLYSPTPSHRKESYKTNTGSNRKKRTKQEIIDDDSDYTDFERPRKKDSRTTLSTYKKRKRSTSETVPKVEEDNTPIIKSKDQVTIKTFYEYVEPYVRDYTQDDVEFLETKNEDVTPYIIPKLGRHYTEVWAEEERGRYIGGKYTGGKYTTGSGYTTSDRNSCGPLTERLLYDELQVKINVTNHNTGGDQGGGRGGGEQSLGEEDEKKDENIVMDDRLRRELKALDLMDEQDVKDDELSIKLRALQEQLKEQVKINNYRKTVLAQKVKDKIAYLQYATYLDDIDAQIEENYLARFPEKDKNGKVSKTKKKKPPPSLEDVKPLLDSRTMLLEGIGRILKPEEMGNLNI